jgi:hypothetical protein
MGKPQDDLADVRIIVESLIRFSNMPWQEFKAHIDNNPKDGWNHLDMPNRGGGRPISYEAGRAFSRLTERHAENQPDGDDIDLNELNTAIRTAFVDFFIVQRKPYDEQKWVDRTLNRAIRNITRRYAERTHYLPCVVTFKPHPSEFSIGPVRFLTQGKFFEDYGQKIKNDYDDSNRQRRETLDARIASGEYRAEDRKSDEETDDINRMVFAWIDDYYRQFTWIAEITVPPCSTKISRERAETTVHAALDVLKLFFGWLEGRDFRLGHQRGAPDKTAHLTRGADGIFRYEIARSDGEGASADDDWYDSIQQHSLWALQAAGSAISAYLSPRKTRSPHRDRWLGALHWYGQAVSEPLPAAQLVKYVATLERLTVLEESKTNAETGGQNVTDVVTRRTALLSWTSEDPSDVAQARQDARTLYKWRSSLMHGRSSPLTKELLNVMHLAHRITREAMFSALGLYVQLDMLGKVEPKDLEARFVELEAPLSESRLQESTEGSTPSSNG